MDALKRNEARVRRARPHVSPTSLLSQQLAEATDNPAAEEDWETLISSEDEDELRQALHEGQEEAIVADSANTQNADEAIERDESLNNSPPLSLLVERVEESEADGAGWTTRVWGFIVEGFVALAEEVGANPRRSKFFLSLPSHLVTDPSLID